MDYKTQQDLSRQYAELYIGNGYAPTTRREVHSLAHEMDDNGSLAAARAEAYCAIHKIEPFGTLVNYNTSDDIRPATEGEAYASWAAAKRDGGAGVISVEIDGVAVSCYVQD